MIDRYLNLFSMSFLGVVLAVFVITLAGTPMGCELGWRMRPEVPWAGSAALLVDSGRDLEIRLTKDGQILVGPMIVPERVLRQQLAEIAKRGVDRDVLIHADGSVPFSLVQTVLAASRDAGFKEVSLVTFRGTLFEAWRKGGDV
jgi:biopolymer transport protein ExbD